MKKIPLLASLLCAALVQTSVTIAMPSDQAQAAESKTIDALVKKLEPKFPGITREDIRHSQIGNLYEIKRGPSISYTSHDGRYLFSGDVLDMDDNYKNITEMARRQARLDELKTIQENQYVSFIPKKVKHTVVVFTDLDCTYCRKLHSEIKGYMDRGIEIKYLAFPRAGAGSASYEKAISVWCSKTPQKELTAAKKGDKIQPNMCDNQPVDMEFQMGMLMGVSGTPTMVLENGALIPGYLPPDKLEKALERLDQL